MVVLEFRIPVPISVEEYEIAQLYMTMKAQEEATKGGEGVVVLKNEPYDNTDGHMGVSEITKTKVPRNKGQYTLKHYHLASKVPGVARAFLPAKSMVLVEEAWNAFPHCKTVLVNGYLSLDKFKIDVETMHLPDAGETENAVGLSEAELKERTVERLNIADVDKDDKDYNPKYDCTLFKSEKTGRGPLSGDAWAAASKPIMTCYKVVRAYFKYWGAQTKVENSITGQQRGLFTKTTGAAFCMMDEWYGLTMEDVRRMEAENAAKLNDKMKDAVAEADAGEGGGK
jgi:hypothetical protein